VEAEVAAEEKLGEDAVEQAEAVETAEQAAEDAEKAEEGS